MKAPQEDANRPKAFTRSDSHRSKITPAQLVTNIQSAGAGVIVTDLEGRVEFLNRTAEQLLGVTSDAAEGVSLDQVFRIEERYGRTVTDNLIELAVLNEDPIDLGHDLVLVSATGETRQVEGEICVCNNCGSITGVVVTFRDVTARQREELQRREAQKIRAVAQLAGAVAHDVNSSLTIIVGQCESIEEEHSNTAHVRDSIAELRRAVGDIATVTRQLLTLSRRAVLSPKAVCMNALLETVTRERFSQQPRKWDLTLALMPKLGTVLVDEEQMKRVLTDLLDYCSDRMPTGGRIEVTTENEVIDGKQRARHSRGFVKLSVVDQGPSVKGAAREQMFEPTWTRGRGVSSGLSLFSIQSAMSAAEGHFSIEDTGEVGARFVLLLPRVEEAAEVHVDLKAEMDKTEQPTILLVEDDDGIRILLRNSLQKRGYIVIEARDGAEGILQAELHEGKINLLVTDVVMPVMDGPTLADAILETRPGTKLLLISGCPEDLVHTQKLVTRGASFLQKPFSQRELVARVDMLLAGC